jgi:hypothetical protein
LLQVHFRAKVGRKQVIGRILLEKSTVSFRDSQNDLSFSANFKTGLANSTGLKQKKP